MTLNLTVLLIGYLFVFPRMAGQDLHRLLYSDMLASLCSVLVSGSLFRGHDITFSFLGLHLGWLGFTLLTYVCLEMPLSLWYLKKHRML